MTKDVLIIIAIIVVVGAAVFYIYRAKKSGQKCVGCPHSKTCGSKNCNCSKK